jgi:hydroxysqualene dehydroxylase
VTIHVVGAGLAGLSAALTLARAGRGAEIVLHEATSLAGGRCRSWHEPRLDATIDNGTHVVVGANVAVRAYLAALGVSDRLYWFDEGIDFLDVGDGARWRVTTPFDLLSVARARGGSAFGAAMTALRLAAPIGAETIAARLGAGAPLDAALWDPLARAVMNTAPERAAAQPFARVLRRTLARGPGAMRVAAMRESLGDCLIDPALDALRNAGVALRLGSRLQALTHAGGRLRSLAFDRGPVELSASDRVILAVPPWEHGRLLPEHAVACVGSPIVNFHVRLAAPVAPGRPILRGLVGGTAEWVLARGTIVSATVSAADALAEADADGVARLLWRDIARAFDIADEMPGAWRVIKERRATPLQDPGFEGRRPGVVTRLANLFIAGDWVAPGLPCTIETAIASGVLAATRLQSAA